MSGFSYPVPLKITSTFNSANFTGTTSTLTLAQTDARYLQLGGGTLSGNLQVSSTSGSTSSTTGALQIAGGAYIGGNSICNGSLQFSTTAPYLNSVINNNSNAIQIYDSKGSGAAMIINCVNRDTAATLLQLQCSAGSADQPFQIQYDATQGQSSGLRIGATNTGAPPYGSNSNLCLMSRNFTRLMLCLNDQYNQLHLCPQSTDIATSFTQNVICGSSMLVRQTLAIGDSSYNSSGLSISALLSTMATGSKNYITLGQTATTNNQAELTFYYAGSGSTSNAMTFGLFGGEYMRLTAQGRLGIGTTTPICPLQVAASASYTQSNIAINSYQNNISTNTWTNLGAGPTTYTLSAAFSSSILVGASVYATSDRRLKTDIVDLDVSYDHYNQLKPKLYRYKNETNTRMGFIAQEMNQVFGNLIMVSENGGLKKETDDDPEDGTQLSIDYQQMTSINTVLIKKLIKDVQDLQSDLIEAQSLWRRASSLPSGI